MLTEVSEQLAGQDNAGMAKTEQQWQRGIMEHWWHMDPDSVGEKLRASTPRKSRWGDRAWQHTKCCGTHALACNCSMEHDGNVTEQCAKPKT